MKRRPTWRQWLSLVLSIGALATAIRLRQAGGLPLLTQDPELERLKAEQVMLAGATDQAVANARLEAQNYLPPGRINQLPPGWRTEALASADPNSTSFRLTHIAPVTWPEIIKVLADRMAQPGARLQSLEIRSRGTRQSREIASVEIVLEQPTETPSRPNPSAGKMFQGASRPATPAAVGAGLSLGGPDGSAEPPPPVSAIALSHPDPRRPRTGSDH